MLSPFVNLFEENQPVALINLLALEDNCKIIKERLNGKLFCAVVKSNAYGHGLVECSRIIEKYCDYFAVATLSEAVTLKSVGITKPVLCLLPINNIARAIEYGIEFVVHTHEYLTKVRNFCLKNKVCAKVHIAINTGMNRLGFDNISELEKVFISLDGIEVKGVFSHLYSVNDFIARTKQLNRFIPFSNYAKQRNSDIITHLASSASLYLNSDFLFDMARIGIAMYGYSAINDTLGLKKVMKVLANRVQGRVVNLGENLLYGDYKLKDKQNLSLYAYGYANGKREGIENMLNNACMNICAVKGDNQPAVIMDDAQDFASRTSTICYDVLTSLGNNCKRVYIYGDLS